MDAFLARLHLKVTHRSGSWEGASFCLRGHCYCQVLLNWKLTCRPLSSRFQEPPVPGLLGHRLFAICLRDLMCIKLCILCSVSMLSVSSSENLMPGKRLSSWGTVTVRSTPSAPPFLFLHPLSLPFCFEVLRLHSSASSMPAYSSRHEGNFYFICM